MDINESQFLSELGNKIKEIRMNSDISLKELSRLSGIDFETLKIIEAGSISVDLLDFVSIAKSLNVPLRLWLNSQNKLPKYFQVPAGSDNENYPVPK